ncbi:MAG TPA: sugar phosphate isomerase/epimerase [Planctomycetota bacterium]|nr:sugar phosphate isomerase/epimerase [Planctomycetota bacterium]
MAFRFAYSTNSYTKWPLDKAIEDVRKRGFEGVEILADLPHAFPGSSLDLEGLKAALAASKLAVANLNGNTTLGLDPKKRDPSGFWPGFLDSSVAVRKMKTEYVKNVIDLAREIGSPAVCTASGVRPAGTSSRDAFSRLGAALEEILDHAARAPQVRVGLEYEPGFFLGDLASTLQVVRELGHPLLGFNLDVGHARCVGDDLEKAIGEAGPRIWNLHVEDIKGRVHDHLVPGRGDLDFAAMFRALERAKYDRFLTLELYPYKDKPGEAGEEGLRYLKSQLKVGLQTDV